jgi:hypothetical protein
VAEVGYIRLRLGEVKTSCGADFLIQITDPADHVGSAMGVLDDPVQRKRKYGRATRPGAATP